MLTATLTIIILGLAAYVGVLLNQRKEHDSFKKEIWQELFEWRNGDRVRDALGCSNRADRAIVALPPEPLYLCQRPTSSKCKDRVKQGEEAPLVNISPDIAPEQWMTHDEPHSTT